MQRFLAAVLLVIAGYAVLGHASAYQVARPATAGSVPVTATTVSRLAVRAGPGNRYGWVDDSSGRVVVDLTKGYYADATGFGFEVGSTYKLKQLLLVTNNEAIARTLSVTVSAQGASMVFSGHINGGAEVSGGTFTLNPGDSVALNLEITPTSSSLGSLAFTFTATN